VTPNGCVCNHQGSQMHKIPTRRDIATTLCTSPPIPYQWDFICRSWRHKSSIYVLHGLGSDDAGVMKATGSKSLYAHPSISFRIEHGESAQKRDCQVKICIPRGICTRYIALAVPALAYFSETWGRVVQNAANLNFRRL
jgi:hypothetical protein